MEKEKAETTRQRESEVRSLSSNLGSLRLENETFKRKLKEIEGSLTQQKQRNDGQYTV